MDVQSKYFPNDDKQNDPSVDYNFWLKSLDTTRLDNQNYIKVPKMFSQEIRLHSYKTLGTPV